MPKSPNIQIPRDLFTPMRTAIREGAKDSRRADRVLHDETRDLLCEADDQARNYVDSRTKL